MPPWIHWTIEGTLIGVSLLAAGHALLHKNDPRAGLGWIFVCLAFPGFGALAYLIFGVDRIRTRGREMWTPGPAVPAEPALPPHVPAEIVEIAKIANAVSRRPLVGGNRVTPLHNGEEAYPAMLAAIDSADRSIDVATYIFETDPVGLRFVDALARAAGRGVEVRVLIDGLGEWYSLPRAGVLLDRRGVRVARFLRPSLRYPRLHLNLRNHRKILVVDERLGFTGGMNLGGRHMVTAPENRRRTVDLHFEIEGPVVAHLIEAFAEDWSFTTREPVRPTNGLDVPPAGEAWCRGISEGPNEDFDQLTWILIGAMGTARRRIRIMTPYFLPTPELIAGLNNAALRGVDVDVVLPRKSNLPFVDWATRAMVWELLQHGVRVHLQLPPFVHSKILLIDDHYAQIGSANLDPRSLKLNFEFNLEVFDPELTAGLDEHFARACAQAAELKLADLESRSLPGRLRDAAAHLFSPYL